VSFDCHVLFDHVLSMSFSLDLSMYRLAQDVQHWLLSAVLFRGFILVASKGSSELQNDKRNRGNQ